MTDDLVTWLRVQLDEDERVARAADVKQGDPEWWVSPVMASGGRHFTVRSKEDHRPIARVERLDGDEDEPAAILDGAAVTEHIARHDPARVLAEVDAKRRILDAGPDKNGYLRYGDWHSCSDECAEIVQVEVIKLLAVPYADRPGYRDEWRP